MKEVLGLEIDTWTALSSIATIIGALGTLAAVIVALRLARRDYEPRLLMHTSIMQVAKMGAGGPPHEMLWITGTNVGQVPVTVKGVYWQFGWFRPTQFVTVPDSNPYSDQLPKELSHSQQARVVMPATQFKDNLTPFIAYLRARWYRRFFIRYARCGFFTSTAEFSGCVAPSVQKLIQEAFDAAGPTSRLRR